MPKNGSPKSYQDGRHSGASTQVLHYLRDHANTEIPYGEIQKAIGAEHAYTVSNAVGYLITKGINIQKPMAGVARYCTGPVTAQVEQPIPTFPRPTESPRMWESVGDVDANTVLIRDESGALWAARRVKDILT